MGSTVLEPRGQMGMTKGVAASDLPALRADYADTSNLTAVLGDGSYRIERFDINGLDLVSAVWDDLADLATLHQFVTPGELLLFDARFLHAGQVNVSDRTRVSTDLRVLTTSALERPRKRYESGGRRVLRFLPGEFLVAEPAQP